MEDFDFRTFAISEHQQLHIDALAELKERLHTPGAVSTADVIKILDNTAKAVGLVREDRAANIGVINLSFEYGGIKVETLPDVPQVDDVTDVEPKAQRATQDALEAPQKPITAPEADNIYNSISSMLEDL